ncbi:MAG: hypothetical protein ACTSQE_16090 [Candidatus Heimdallarchaeaceae archaeon]
MATETKAYQDITIALTFDDDAAIDAEINGEDNNDPDCYIPNTDYYVRLYKSNNNISVIAKANFGLIVPYQQNLSETITDEEMIFLKAQEGSVGKMIHGGFSYLLDGLAYNEDLEEVIPIVSHTIGSKAIRLDLDVFCVMTVSYYTEYMLYRFRTSRTGKLLLSFMGT